ncbi:WD40 repeat domain-containing protein [Nostoc sp.]
MKSQGNLNRVNFSSDGKYLTITSDKNTASIWDTSGREIAKLPNNAQIESISFSPNGQLLVTK